MSNYILECKNLSFKYPDGTLALKDVSIKLEEGKKIAFLGVNGSGKSTLFLNFNGILKPSEGFIYYNGEEIKYNTKHLRQLRKNIGIVFQDPENQLFSANVYQEVSFGAMNLKLPEEEVKKRVDKALNDTGMYSFKDKAVHFLSYGQKKRISISDILVMDPKVIILDEPTSSLDPKHSSQVVEMLNELNSKGMTVILSTHDVDLAYQWADYIFIMKDGALVKEGAPEEVLEDSEFLQQCYLKKPTILTIYEELIALGKIREDKGVPRGLEELINLLRTYK
ncbi:energy-coupling factor ABC transporter ATP-binding protein [Clostridium manihotivorum]|uniref:ABC transporter ATP-binding protein n=1 Tax=Clostridium manihotivorum TaxID=2320868 RepID=A0A3R5QRG2_9CLOT|nr:ATP-binding cassette domain-containing protein [Clostridium manihotivorum]QAA31014.1 energy-coupling factor ABC transporter ATP-binding protein [Clostridium manihotivorum]